MSGQPGTTPAEPVYIAVTPDPLHEPRRLTVGLEILGQGLADAFALRQAMGDWEQGGLYRAAAQHLGIPGDITRGTVRWHPDRAHEPTDPSHCWTLISPADRAAILAALKAAGHDELAAKIGSSQ